METRLKKSDSMALKGVAILLMLFHHCYRSADKYVGYSIIFTPLPEEWVINVGMYAKICVSIFAFVSGYGLMHGYSRLADKENPKVITKWIGKHIISTMSGFWFIAVISYLVSGLLRGNEFAKWGESPLEKIWFIFIDCLGLSGLLDTKSLNGTWWYIGAAVVFVVMIPILARFIERFGALECVLIVFFLPRVLQLGFLGGQSAYSFLMAVLLGMLCYKYDFFAKFESWKLFENVKLNEGIKFLSVLILVLFGVWSAEKIELKILWEYKYAIVPLFVILFCVEYLFRLSFIKRILEFLGKHSNNIWLVHTFARDWLAEYVWSVKYFLLVPAVILAISLAASFVINGLKKISGYDAMVQKLSQRI